jgi:hypothetical protein
MPWGRLDDGLYDHPKLEALGRLKLAAIGLWTLSISWSNRRLTDGSIPTRQIRMLGGTTALADLLVAAGFFDRTDDGYAIHDFLEFNENAVTVQSRRDAAAERQRRHRAVTRDSDNGVTGDVTRDSHVTHARASDRASRPDPSNTRPNEETPKSPRSGDHRSRRANGTNPRAQGTNPRAVDDRVANERRRRANERRLAYARGAITEDQLEDMTKRDAPVEEIPDWAEHQERRTRESLIEGPLAELVDAG